MMYAYLENNLKRNNENNSEILKVPPKNNKKVVKKEYLQLKYQNTTNLFLKSTITNGGKGLIYP